MIAFALLWTLALAPSLLCAVTARPQDKNGAVACESAVCSRIGINVMSSGGNAADAVWSEGPQDEKMTETSRLLRQLCVWESWESAFMKVVVLETDLSQRRTTLGLFYRGLATQANNPEA